MRHVIPSCWIYIRTFPLAFFQNQKGPIHHQIRGPSNKKNGPKSPRTCFQIHLVSNFLSFKLLSFVLNWILEELATEAPSDKGNVTVFSKPCSHNFAQVEKKKQFCAVDFRDEINGIKIIQSENLPRFASLTQEFVESPIVQSEVVSCCRPRFTPLN